MCKYRVRGNVSCLVFWDRVELSDAGDASVVLTHWELVYAYPLQRGAPSGNVQEAMSSSSHPSVDIKFDFVPFNGTPGETYDKWERALLNAGAKADDRGCTDFNGCHNRMEFSVPW